MHYSPRIWQRRGPSGAPPPFPLAYPPLPFFFPSSPFQPAARFPNGAVALSRWPTNGCQDLSTEGFTLNRHRSDINRTSLQPSR